MATIQMFMGTNSNDGYLQWIKDHPNGYVLNCEKSPRATYLILHKASCYTINDLQKQAESWTEKYNKICSIDIKEIEVWAQKNVPGYQGLRHCAKCEP